MRRLTGLSPVAIVVLLLVCAANVRAEIVTYQFNGTCFSGAGDCAFYGLSDGDPISGSITLDNQFLSYTEFTDILPTEPYLDFSFAFGNETFSKGDLAPDAMRIKYGDPGGLELQFQNPAFACLNAISPCGIVQEGTVVLSFWTSFQSIRRLIPPGNSQEEAYGNGAWTIVPIPAAFWLFGSALGLLGWATRKKS